VAADNVTDAVPDVPLPVKLPPLAEQLVAFVELHVSVMLEPVTAVATLEVNVTLGGE
jgi:hypothetical protein